MIHVLNHDQVDQHEPPFDGEPVVIRHWHDSEAMVQWSEVTWVPEHLDGLDEEDEDNYLGTIEGGFFRSTHQQEIDLYLVSHWIHRVDVEGEVDSEQLEQQYGQQEGLI